MAIFVILPIMGAFIGWGTNLLAIRSLFRPVRPLRIPFTSRVIQGLIPRRQKELATSIGNLVEQELVSWEDLMVRIESSSFERKVLTSVEGFAREWVNGKLPRLMPRPINEALEEYFAGAVLTAFRDRLPEIMEKLAGAAREEVNIRMLVEEKIGGKTLESMEGLVFSVARQELKQIEYLGAGIGFVIGTVQALAVYFWSLP